MFESIADPKQVVSSQLKVSELDLCSITDTALTVVSNKEDVKIGSQSHTLKHLLSFEPYAGLDQDTLQCIFSEKKFYYR